MFAVLLFIVISDRPKVPPSAVSLQDQDKDEQAFLQNLKEAFKLRSYVLLLVVFGIINGSLISFPSIMSVLFNHFNIDGQP